MTKFVYKMESILKIKYKLEEQAKIAFGNANIRLIQEEEKLEGLFLKKLKYQTNQRNSMQSKLKIIEIKQCEEAIEIMKLFIKQQQVAVKKAEQQLEKARVQLNKAMIDRKTHENLKAKALDNFILEYEAEQRKEVDELVSYKYNSPTDNQEN